MTSKRNKQNQLPLGLTPKGVDFAAQIGLDLPAARAGLSTEVHKYAYCVAAGVAAENEQPFTKTIEQFIKACDGAWLQAVTQHLATGSDI